MANYSLFDSASRTVANHHHPFKTISLGFLLLSISLISISCASFGQQHHQFKRHQNSYSTPSDSDDNTNLDSLLGQWAPSPVSHVSYKALPLESAAAAGSNYEPSGRQQQHSGSSSYSVSPSLAEDRQKFYNQIQLLANNNNYYDDQNDENVIVRPATVFETTRPNLNVDRFENDQRTIQYGQMMNNDYNQLAPLMRDSEIYYSSPSHDGINAIARKKLLELLSANSRNVGGTNEHQLSDDYQFLLEPNSKPQHISIYQNLDNTGADETASLARGQQQEEINKNFAYQVEQQPQPQSQQIRTTDETEKRSGSQKDDKIENGASNNNITLTTLLEDDEDKNVDAKEDTTKVSSESNNDVDKKINTTSGETVRKEETDTPFIRVVTVEGKSDDNHRWVSTDDTKSSSPSTKQTILQATASKIGSLFSGMYNLVSSHLPSFWSSPKQDKPVIRTTTTTTSFPSTLSSKKTEQRQRMTIDDDDDDEHRRNKTTTSFFSKLSVSEPANKLDVAKGIDEIDKNTIMTNDISNNNNSITIQGDERNKWSIDEENNDKQTLMPISQAAAAAATNIQQQQTTTTTFDKQQDSDSDLPVKVQSSASRKLEDLNQEGEISSSLLSSPPFESAKRIEIRPHDIGGEGSGHKISLLRQSTNLMMPYKSSDEFIVEPINQQHQPSSLFGKYIYAPEHHYHLSTSSSFADSKQPIATAAATATAPMATVNHPLDDDNDSMMAANDVDDDEQMFTRMSSRSARQSIHAGDNVYAGSFSSLRPFYAASHLAATNVGNDRLGLMSVNNKSNDIYFLVMVAAFCCMAMAVVLAAGLFAYRVQQQRKSTPEADYPTYGVVGPNNNMVGSGAGGKCGGAASFVGGYFAGVGGPGSSSSGSKSGSVKQLADMYSIGADSGISGTTGARTSPAGGKRVILSSDQNNGGSQSAVNGTNSSNNNNHNNNNNNNNSGQARFANQNAARMFHYQNQKQQMIISDRSSNGRHTSASDLDSEDENDENSYTVYECPGLASAHEMEIKNPLFNDDQTP